MTADKQELPHCKRARTRSGNRGFLPDPRILGVFFDTPSFLFVAFMFFWKDQSIAFIYIKATEGSGTQDDKFSVNWENAKRSGLPAGAYHFFSFDSKGETQAESFIKTVGTELKGRLLPAVDVEYYGDKEKNPPKKEDVVRELRSYLERIEKAYGVKPLVYTGADIYEKYLKGEFDEYKKWISSLFTPLSWNYKDDWYIWQYLNRGELQGYSGGEKYIDLNVLNKEKSLDDLIVR